MLSCGPDCGCDSRGVISLPLAILPAPGLNGWLATALNVAASAAGIPVPIGTIAESGVTPGYAVITQTPDQIAKTVASKVQAAMGDPPKVAPDARSQAVADAALPQIAQDLAAGGYSFPAGSMGAQLAHPDVFGAFGGNSGEFVKWGFVGLGALLLLKVLK